VLGHRQLRPAERVHGCVQRSGRRVHDLVRHALSGLDIELQRHPQLPTELLRVEL
jgi:hypothetical protein